MTKEDREESVRILKMLIPKDSRGNGKVKTNIAVTEAIVNAVEALEQEPCEDCISRKRLLEKIDAERKHLLDLKMDGAEHIVVHHVRRIIEDMPSVNPQEPKTEWIPVTEKLPEEGEDVLVWYEYFRYGDYNCMWQTYGIGWQYDGHFSVDNGGSKQRVIAWCELPKPYEESEE